MVETTNFKKLFWQCLTAFSLPIVAVLIAAFVVNQANAPANRIRLAPLSDMPQFVHDTLPEAQQAYQFAVANQDLIRNFPCYCGCVYMGHENNLDCYIQEVTEDDAVVYDEHASACGICVEITTDVMRLWSQGQEIDDIYTAIVDTYSQRGPSTEEPV